MGSCGVSVYTVHPQGQSPQSHSMHQFVCVGRQRDPTHAVQCPGETHGEHPAEATHFASFDSHMPSAGGTLGMSCSHKPLFNTVCLFLHAQLQRAKSCFSSAWLEHAVGLNFPRWEGEPNPGPSWRRSYCSSQAGPQRPKVL